MVTSPTRKSGRQRVPNKKYTNDAFDDLNKVLSSDSEEEEFLQQQQLLDDESDEFPADQILAADQEDEESLADDASDGSEIMTPVEEYEDAHSYASSDPGSPGVPHRISLDSIDKPRRMRERQVRRDPNTHTRGMLENPFRKDTTRSVVRLLAGGGNEDISHVVKSRHHWAVDPTLPLKSKFRPSLSFSDEKQKMETTVGWDWYYDHGGREIFAKNQHMQMLALDEASAYSGPINANAEFVMGPYGKQQKFSLEYANALTIDQAWSAVQHEAANRNRRRHGWMLNVGACVKCLDWVSNQEGKYQHLAVSTSQFPPSSPDKDPPAFTAFPGPSSLEIWRFHAMPATDHEIKPTLLAILCSDWGEIRKLKWCPVPRKERSSTSPSASVSSSISLGLLAGIWKDGVARVLDVELHETGEDSVRPQAFKYYSAAFIAFPPDNTVSTCLTWLSASDLAIGYSNGEVAIYDICPSARPNVSESPVEGPPQDRYPNQKTNPLPWFSLPLHSTYVLGLTSGYPAHPSLLVSSSMNGFLRMTSLLAPTTDFVLSQRTRAPPSSLAYYDPLISVVGTEENSETIRMWGLRCFYASSACGNLNSSPGPGSCITDTGKCHPSIAAGTTDGSVIVTNPMRKTLSKKQVGYQQVICKHEWRPTAPSDDATRPRIGISRFTEGFKPVRVTLGSSKRPGATKVTIATTSIHEKETAVTALAWNPNMNCGGWLAVGWASGLIRVQDVAI